MDCLVQDYSISSVLAMEILQSSSKKSIRRYLCKKSSYFKQRLGITFGSILQDMINYPHPISLLWISAKRYLGHGLVITSHYILWDVITYPCPALDLLFSALTHIDGKVQDYGNLLSWPLGDFNLMLGR